jgi:hypothetical protein
MKQEPKMLAVIFHCTDMFADLCNQLNKFLMRQNFSGNVPADHGGYTVYFFYSHSRGWSPYWVYSARRPLLAYCTCPGWLWWWRIWWNEDWQGNPKYSVKICSSATLSTTNPTWPDSGSNPGRRGGKPATNRLSYGAATTRSKSWTIFDRSKAGIMVSNPTWGMDIFVRLFCLCCPVCRQRPWNGLITRPRSPAVCLKKRLWNWRRGQGLTKL